ncbi:MAG TPA: serine/threonine-protein kinase [Polyangiaceae bacterium]|nr:serine/threonine-protein kinase [Polyangiaceae bacterium]
MSVPSERPPASPTPSSARSAAPPDSSPAATLRSLSPFETAHDTLPPKERPTIKGEIGVDFGPDVRPYDDQTEVDDIDEVDPFLGTTIDGRYVLESVVGIGGMGIVYAGRHVLINKRVAIKVLRADMTRDKEMLDRFRREAQAASSIGHAHIIDVSDYGQLPDGSAFLVMEFLEGKSLAQEMRAKGPLPAKRIVHIARQVADALAAAHALGIVHRDLKPDNVHLIARGADEDFVKILDFGIAKMAGPGTDRLTRAGTVFGTPHYMAPEQAAGTNVDHRTDIYSLGVILYEMVSGTLPFDADNYMGILTQHMYKAPASLRTGDSAPPPALEAIVLKALAKIPAHRYQSMSELIEDLDRFSNGQMPEAVREMLGNKGALAVPLDYFQGTAPGVASGQPAEPRTGWGLYARLALFSLAAAALIPVLAVLAFRSGAAEQPAAPGPPPAASEAASARAAPPPAPPPSAPPAAAPSFREVIVAVEPRTAEVFVDGLNKGRGPFVTVHVPAGQSVNVEAQLKGYQPKGLRVDDSKRHVELRLQRAGKGGPRPPAAGTGGGKRMPDQDIGSPPSTTDAADPWGKR